MARPFDFEDAWHNRDRPWPDAEAAYLDDLGLAECWLPLPSGKVARVLIVGEVEDEQEAA